MNLRRLTAALALAAAAAVPASAQAADNASVKISGVQAQPGALPSTGAPLYVSVRVERTSTAAVSFRLSAPSSFETVELPAGPVICAATAPGVLDCTAAAGAATTARFVFVPRQEGALRISVARTGAADSNPADDQSVAAVRVLSAPTLAPNVEVEEPDFSDLELDDEDAEQAQQAIDEAAQPAGKLHLVTESARITSKRVLQLKVLCAGGPCKQVKIKLAAKGKLSKTVTVAAVADGKRANVRVKLTAAQTRKFGRKAVKVKVTGLTAARTVTVRR